MPRPKVFISHSSKTPETTAFLDQVYVALKQHGSGQSFDVFLDREEIYTGEEWHKKILNNLCTCDAVVLLLSEAALASPWVRQEAAFSAIRRFGDPSLKLVVVIIDDTVSVQKIEQCEFLGGVARLHDVQFTTKAPNDIIEELANVTNRSYSLLDNSLEDMCSALEAIRPDILAQAIRNLDDNRIATLPWNTAPAHILALSVVDEPSKALRNFHDLLLPAMRRIIHNRRDSAIVLLESVKPLWVEPKASKNLFLAQQNKENKAPLTINGFNQQNFTAESYADRAWGKGKYLLVSVGSSTSEVQILNILRSTVVPQTMHKHFVDARIKKYRKPILVVFSSPEPGASELLLPDENLLERITSLYPTAVILLPTGEASPQGRPDLQPLEPKLDTEEEDRQFDDYLDVNDYIATL